MGTNQDPDVSGYGNQYGLPASCAPAVNISTGHPQITPEAATANDPRAPKIVGHVSLMHIIRFSTMLACTILRTAFYLQAKFEEEPNLGVEEYLWRL